MRPFLLTGCVLVALLGTTGLARADEPGVVTFGADGAGEGLQASYDKGLTLDAAGNIYVLDPDPHNRVLKFSPALQYLTSWGSIGVGNGEFEMPRGVAIDPAGNVKVGEANGYRIQTFAPTGGFMASSVISQSTGDIAIDSGGNIYYGGFGGVITKFDSTGTWLGSFDDSGYITGLGIDPATGHVYAANSESHHIRVLDSELAPVRTFGSLGAGAGQYNQPVDVVVAGDAVYVSERGTPRLQRFSREAPLRFATRAGPG